MMEGPCVREVTPGPDIVLFTVWAGDRSAKRAGAAFGPAGAQRMSMAIEFVRSETEWSGWKETWNELLSRSPADSPFLRWEYQTAWWRHRGGGEWPSADLYIAVWREDGSVRGIAPLLRSVDQQGPAFHLIGSVEISDYLDFIAPSEFLACFVEMLLDALASAPPEEWRRLDFCNLPPASATLSVLSREAEKRGWQWEVEPLQICPVIRLPESWDRYLETLDKKQRHEIRRKLRRAEEGEEKAVLRRATPQRLKEDVDEFLRLMAYDERKAAFLTLAMRAQFHALAAAAAEAGMLQLSFLDVDGKAAAGFFNFDYRDRIWVYNSGINPGFSAMSPGWVLLALLLRQSIEQGKREFDFLRGNESYKFQWGGQGEMLNRLIVHRG
jgi:CelD/BcsL family acetyltransferase involved in cellulose biosynthesis